MPLDHAIGTQGCIYEDVDLVLVEICRELCRWVVRAGLCGLGSASKYVGRHGRVDLSCSIPRNQGSLLRIGRVARG